jgi:hypothetical protein
LIQHQDIIKQFENTSLKEMESVKLMNRTDTKFVLTFQQFEDLLPQLIEYYKVLEVEGVRLCRYLTLYYDTNKMDLYTQHHNGKLNRYKIRHRTYVESQIGFLEVKFKNNKGRTIKTRISKKEIPPSMTGDSEVFLKKMLPFQPNALEPVLWINYNRYTLVNKTSQERVTLDLDLEFVKDGISEKLGGIVIAEVKQDKKQSSPFISLMKQHHIRDGSISKYCMGIAMTYPHLKINNFKTRLTTIKRKNLC